MTHGLASRTLHVIEDSASLIIPHPELTQDCMDSTRLGFAGSHWLLRQATTSKREPSGHHSTKLQTALPSVSTWPQEHAGQAEGMFPLPGKLFLPQREQNGGCPHVPLSRQDGGSSGTEGNERLTWPSIRSTQLPTVSSYYLSF